MKQYIFHGMQRSGNHAILNWAIGAVAENTVLLNDCLAENFTAKHGLGLSDSVKKAIAEVEPDYLVYTVEDYEIGEAKKILGDSGVDVASATHVLVLRDPYNLFASRGTRYDASRLGGFSSLAVETWKSHARTYLKGDLVNANFNIWFLQRDYRLLLAKRLGLPFTDDNKEGIMDLCGGSSFDGMKYNGRASEMKVLERYKKVDTRWLDGEVRDLHQQIFHTALAGELKELSCNLGS
jgi:hypothetical protein